MRICEKILSRSFQDKSKTENTYSRFVTDKNTNVPDKIALKKG
jgi:hypothetical protein